MCKILVILSPTNAYGTKTEYTLLCKFLLSDGYLRIAPEVFERIITDRKSAQKHLKRLEKYKPKTGCVRVIQLTEKQYHKTIYLSNHKDTQEEYVGSSCHICIE